MARPQKCRMICSKPKAACFEPKDIRGEEPVIMGYDEYETVRLLDFERFSQEQCAARMRVSRPTVTRMYDSARRKMAEALVSARPLLIEGGDVLVCPAKRPECGDALHCCHQNPLNTTNQAKEGLEMKLAITYQEGMIFQHFGHSEAFKIYDIANGQVTGSQVVPTNGSGHGALAGFLTSQGVDTLICGGIGGGAKAALAEAGIRLYCGASGSADEAARALLNGTLVYNADIVCSHHHEHEESHDNCHPGGCGGSCHHE